MAYKINFKANICARIFDVIWLDCLSGDNAIFFLTKILIDSILECKWNKYIDFYDGKYIKY